MTALRPNRPIASWPISKSGSGRPVFRPRAVLPLRSIGARCSRAQLLPLCLAALERQRHAAQVAPGLHQNQRPFVELRYGRALARHMDGFGLCGNGCLGLGHAFRLRVDPLQTRVASDLHQILQGQLVGLDLRQGRALGLRCRLRGRRSANCGSGRGFNRGGSLQRRLGVGCLGQVRRFFRTICTPFTAIAAIAIALPALAWRCPGFVMGRCRGAGVGGGGWFAGSRCSLGRRAAAARSRAVALAPLAAGPITALAAALAVCACRGCFTGGGLHGRQVGCGQLLLADFGLTGCAALAAFAARTSFASFARWPSLALFARGWGVTPSPLGRALAP